MNLDLTVLIQFWIFSSFTSRIHFDKSQIRTAVHLAPFFFFFSPSHIAYVPIELNFSSPFWEEKIQYPFKIFHKVKIFLRIPITEKHFASGSVFDMKFRAELSFY